MSRIIMNSFLEWLCWGDGASAKDEDQQVVCLVGDTENMHSTSNEKTPAKLMTGASRFSIQIEVTSYGN